jgi:hypothetical protein
VSICGFLIFLWLRLHAAIGIRGSINGTIERHAEHQKNKWGKKEMEEHEK